MASSDEWRREYSFLEPEDIGSAFVSDTSITEDTGEARGCREDLYFEFDRTRPVTVRELSPALSTSILDSYGFDPYSNDYFLKSEALLTEDGDEFLRIGYQDNAVYFEIGDSSLPEQPEYLEAEEPRWRA